MKKIVYSWLLVLVCTSVHAQIITVLEKENKAPLEGVNVVSGYPANIAVTDAQGHANISDFNSSDKIQVSMIGYEKELLTYEELSYRNFTVYLSRDGISLDHVVISASKQTQSSADVPYKVTTISAQRTALQNPQTAADMLNISGEVFIQKSQQGGGSPMIRGFATNRLLYTVDCVRMNTAIFRSGNLQNVISLDPFAIEETEVLFGPGSVIYGSDAIGGVMSFQTLTPQFSKKGSVVSSGNAVVRYASANNERTGHFDVNIGGKKLASVTSVSYNNYGDLRMGSKGPVEYKRPYYVQRIGGNDVLVANEDPLVQKPTAYEQVNMMQKLRYAPNKYWDIQYGFHYSQTSDYSRYDRHLRSRKGLPRSAEWRYGPQIWMMNNLSITHRAVKGVYDVATIRVAHQLFKESRIDRGFNDPKRRTREEQVNAYSLGYDLNKKLGKNNLYYGIEVVRDEVDSRGVNEDINTGMISAAASRYPQSDWSSYAAYVSYQHFFSKKVIMQGGLRYNHYVVNANFDTNFYPFPFSTASLSKGALSGSLGGVYHPDKTWSVRLNLSTGFRAPNIDDIGKVFDSEPGSVVVPNPSLGAEYAYNGEIGIAKVFGKRFKIDFTGYYTLLENALVRRNFALNGQDSIIYDGAMSRVQAIQNAATSKVHGVQAGIEVKLLRGVTLHSKFNYQLGEDELDNGTLSPSRHAAPWFGISRVVYTNNKLTLEVNTIYSGERTYGNMPFEEIGKDYLYAIDKNGSPYSPGWYTLNLKLLYKLTDKLWLTTGLENITDQRYRTYSSGVAAAGRNFIMALRADL